MRLPKPGCDIVIARDKYRNKVFLNGTVYGFDLQTDGRVALTPRFAIDLAEALLKAAKAIDSRKMGRKE